MSAGCTVASPKLINCLVSHGWLILTGDFIEQQKGGRGGESVCVDFPLAVILVSGLHCKSVCLLWAFDVSSLLPSLFDQPPPLPPTCRGRSQVAGQTREEGVGGGSGRREKHENLTEKMLGEDVAQLVVHRHSVRLRNCKSVTCDNEERQLT